MNISSQGILSLLKTDFIKNSYEPIQKAPNLQLPQKIWCWIRKKYVSVEKCLKKCKYNCNAFKYYQTKINEVDKNGK